MGGGSVEYAGKPEVSSATEGNCGGPVLRAGSLPPRGAALLLRICERGGRVVIGTNGIPGLAVSEKGVTPALRAISCSPICQCIASAARHGIDISSAILDHMSALNLRPSQSARSGTTRCRARLPNIPLVQPCKLILTIFVPLTPSLEIVLVVQATADCASSWQMLTDVLPLHSVPTELDDLCVFLWRPLGLLFGRRFSRVCSGLSFRWDSTSRCQRRSICGRRCSNGRGY